MKLLNFEGYWSFIKFVFNLLRKKTTWLVILFLAWTWLVSYFFSNYYLQVPFIIKTRPLIEKRYKMPLKTEKPRRTQVVRSAKVVEVTPTPVKETSLIPFRKFLTPQGEKNREVVLAKAKIYYTGDELIAFDNLLKKEAGYETTAVNPDSGACGIFQSHPCSKMGCPLNNDGLDCQFQWGVGYLNRRYGGSPLKAWNYHLANNSY